MTRMIEAVREFTQATSTVRFTVNAWTADNVFLEGEDSIAYRADGSIRVNPARVLTESRAVRERLAELEPSWLADDIRQALDEACTYLRNQFQVREDGDEVVIELQGRRLRIRPETWRGAVADIAAVRRVNPRAVRAELLDQGRLTLANSIAAFEWT